jgi:hypothetical protein
VHEALGGAFPKRHHVDCGVIAIICKVPVLGRHILDPPDLVSMMEVACSMFRGKAICPLGFSHRGDFIGKGAASEVGLGGLTTGGHGQGLGRAPWW